MRDHSKNYLSEFEREFEAELQHDNYEMEDDEFEFENDEFESNDEFEDDEFELENEFEFENNEFEQDNQDHYFENRLYELFTNNYESEFEFENGFNEILHEMEQDYFWKKLKKLGSKALKIAAPLAQKALKQIPGGDKYAKLLQSLTSDPRGFLRNAVKTFGPMALNAIAPGAGSALGAVMNSEVSVPPNRARQAAVDTVAMAKQAYTGFANNITKIPPSSNPNVLKNNLNIAAKSAIQGAKTAVSSNRTYGTKQRLLSRKIQQVGGYKVITSIYQL